VYRWAEENPLRTHTFLRRSVSEAVVDDLSKQHGGGLSQLGSMTQMAEDAQQMALVLASYAPKEIRWQTELMLADVADTSMVAPMLDTIQQMELVDATTDFMRQTPSLIAEERAAVFMAIADERNAVLSDIERQRIETLAQTIQLVQTEREIMFREVTRMIAAERAEILASVQVLTSQSFDETRGVIDHLLMRIAMMGIGLAVLVAAGYVVYSRRGNR
jgi:hypothetical protein